MCTRDRTIFLFISSRSVPFQRLCNSFRLKLCTRWTRPFQNRDCLGTEKTYSKMCTSRPNEREPTIPMCARVGTCMLRSSHIYNDHVNAENCSTTHVTTSSTTTTMHTMRLCTTSKGTRKAQATAAEQCAYAVHLNVKINPLHDTVFAASSACVRACAAVIVLALLVRRPQTKS